MYSKPIALFALCGNCGAFFYRFDDDDWQGGIGLIGKSWNYYCQSERHNRSRAQAPHQSCPVPQQRGLLTQAEMLLEAIEVGISSLVGVTWDSAST
jgi:hypothetical protein